MNKESMENKNNRDHLQKGVSIDVDELYGIYNKNFPMNNNSLDVEKLSSFNDNSIDNNQSNRMENSKYNLKQSENNSRRK